MPGEHGSCCPRGGADSGSDARALSMAGNPADSRTSTGPTTNEDDVAGGLAPFLVACCRSADLVALASKLYAGQLYPQLRPLLEPAGWDCIGHSAGDLRAFRNRCLFSNHHGCLNRAVKRVARLIHFGVEPSDQPHIELSARRHCERHDRRFRRGALRGFTLCALFCRLLRAAEETDGQYQRHYRFPIPTFHALLLCLCRTILASACENLWRSFAGYSAATRTKPERADLCRFVNAVCIVPNPPGPRKDCRA